jgi:hypothetical protein
MKTCSVFRFEQVFLYVIIITYRASFALRLARLYIIYNIIYMGIVYRYTGSVISVIYRRTNGEKTGQGRHPYG